MLEGEQKLSVGELIRAILACILFPLYLVFCLVYHQFWALLCVLLSCRWCSSRWIEERANRRQMSEFSTKEESMLRHEVHSAKKQRAACHNMTYLCCGMPKLVKNRFLRSCQSMPKSCRGMTTPVRKICNVYFWQLGFNAF